MQRKLYNHLTSILFEKHYGCVFCFTERCFPESNEVPCRRSENMACWREQRLVGGEKAMWSKFEGSVWLVARCETKRHHAAVGWTQCSFFALAIMRSIYGTCAIYVYKIFSWTETHENPHIYVYYDPIQYMNNFMMLSCERSVRIYKKNHCLCRI